jgi:hypothetical protein
MKLSDKIVTDIPLETIWTDEEQLQASRESYLTDLEVHQLLKSSTIQFIVADPGQKLKWVDINDCFRFWKTEVSKHLANDFNEIELDTFPDNYAYLASRWTAENKPPIIVLEKYH